MKKRPRSRSTPSAPAAAIRSQVSAGGLTLSQLLSLNGHFEGKEHLERAERLAPEIVTRTGILIARGEVAGEIDDLHVLVGDSMLNAKDRQQIDDAEKWLGKAQDAAGYNLENFDIGAISADLYSPQIEMAYYLGLALGWHAAQKFGGAQ